MLTLREPALVEQDFERYVKSMFPLMLPGRDVMWVLGGRTDTNRAKVPKILAKNGFNHRMFHLCYNTKLMMQYGHFKRQRGIARSRNHEILYLCFKHRMPKNLAKTRVYVDGGSAVFNEVVRNVPVLSHKHHALVSKEVREESLSAMVGVDVAEVEAREAEDQPPIVLDEDEATAAEPAATADAASEKVLLTAAVKKRKLYRQLTGTEVTWFPHDNDIELLKELVHEAGRPRWVYFGTPAGGAGIHGCIEMGCSVLALCYDEHHRKNLEPFLVQRAVGAMLGSNTMVFHNDALMTRAKQLKLTKDDTKDDEKEDKNKEKEKEKEKEDKKKKKEKNNKEDKKKRKHVSSDSDSDSNSTSDDDASPKKKKNKKA